MIFEILGASGEATEDHAGLMSASDKQKLNKIYNGATQEWLLFNWVCNATTINNINMAATGRNISDFSVLFFMFFDGTDNIAEGGLVRATQIIPTSLFKSGYKAALTYVNSANTQFWAEVTYVDDTHIKLDSSSNSVSSNKRIRVYGLGHYVY